MKSGGKFSPIFDLDRKRARVRWFDGAKRSKLWHFHPSHPHVCVTPELPTLLTMGKTLDGATATMKKVSDPCLSCERWRDRGVNGHAAFESECPRHGAVEHKKCKEQTERAVMACGRPWGAMGEEAR